MNKTQLVDAIASRANITKVDAKRALDALIEVTGRFCNRETRSCWSALDPFQ